jgi:catechol 2,3-dioxygenase-like lactoylglutathione lyase family enzyme
MMAIIGIETLLFGVDDLPTSTRFLSDIGLPLVSSSASESRFTLPDNSKVVLKDQRDPSLPPSRTESAGVREVVWGIDTTDSLQALASGLSSDHALQTDEDGTVHFDAGFGVPMALRLFNRTAVRTAPEPLNAPGVVNRLNRNRKWRQRARPKSISHVVFAAKDYHAAAGFMCRRLGFRISDIQESFAIYMRADGTTDHHNFLLVNAGLPMPGFDGTDRFHHANFAVEDIDEIMVGVNHMQRHGWESSEVGLGRHRIDSALFYYFPSPLGGEIELGADSDQVDDSWIPRRWPVALFAYAVFTHNLLPFLKEEPEWTFEFITGDPLDLLEGSNVEGSAAH